MKSKLSRQVGTVYFYTMNMYFIALVAPEEINQQVLKWKLWMKDRFGCEVALKSPAHITLVPPFWMKPELEKDLENSLAELAATQKSFLIQLKNFHHFKSRVIFVDATANHELAKMKDDLSGFLFTMNKYPIKKERRSFSPHITIATRDLYKKAFYEAWEHFKEKKYEANWVVDSVSLLRHNKKNWEVIMATPFR